MLIDLLYERVSFRSDFNFLAPTRYAQCPLFLPETWVFSLLPAMREETRSFFLTAPSGRGVLFLLFFSFLFSRLMYLLSFMTLKYLTPFFAVHLFRASIPRIPNSQIGEPPRAFFFLPLGVPQMGATTFLIFRDRSKCSFNSPRFRAKRAFSPCSLPLTSFSRSRICTLFHSPPILASPCICSQSSVLLRLLWQE